MAENCKNCNEVIAGNFCINCGQKKYKRIDRKYIWDEMQYTFLHANKGLLFSAKNILKNPGKTAREFIDGNRVNHYKPILLAFVLCGIATVITSKFVDMSEIMVDVYKNNKQFNGKIMGNVMYFLEHYYSMIAMALIPFFAITTIIPFRKWGHNYYEHIVMNAYFLSYYTLISIIIVDPIMFFFRHSLKENIFNISSFVMLLVPVMLVWFYKGFYSDKPLKSIILKVLATIGLLLLAYIVVIFIAVIVGIIYATINGPETLKQFKPTAIN